MAQIKLDTNYAIRLSLNSIDEYKKYLEEKQKEMLQKTKNVVQEVSKIGLEGNHKSTELLPVKYDGSVVSGGIKTTDPVDTYREYGTGIVGSNNPHPDIMTGWKYDVNEHGEKGWIYPKGDGTYGWTKGLPAEKKFYEAMERMEAALPKIVKEEFSK